MSFEELFWMCTSLLFLKKKINVHHSAWIICKSTAPKRSGQEMLHTNSWEKSAFSPRFSSCSCVTLFPSNCCFLTEKLVTKLAIIIWHALELEIILHKTQLIVHETCTWNMIRDLMECNSCTEEATLNYLFSISWVVPRRGKFSLLSSNAELLKFSTENSLENA